MTVSPGNRVSAAVTNAAFMSRTSDTSTTGSIEARLFVDSTRTEAAAASIPSLTPDKGLIIITGAVDTDILAVSPGVNGQILRIVNGMAANNATLSFPTPSVIISPSEMVILIWSSTLLVWTVLASSAAAIDFTVKYALFHEEQALGVDAGTFTTGSPQTRNLNVTVQAQAFATLAANQVTVQPGDYKFSCWGIAHRVAAHVVRLQNITGAVTFIQGTTSVANNAVNRSETMSIITQFYFKILAATVIEVQHEGGTSRAADGFGLANPFGVGVFSALAIERLDI